MEAMALKNSHMKQEEKIPWFVKSVFILTLMCSFPIPPIFGINFTGIAWIMALILALFFIFNNSRLNLISFPFWIWLPWTILLIINLLFVNYQSLDPRVIPIQRTVQLLCPIAIGIVASTLRPSDNFISKIEYYLRLLGVLIFGASLFFNFNAFINSAVTGLAPQVMTGIFLSAIYINSFYLTRKTSFLLLFSLMTALPFLALTRTVTAVMFLAAPLSFFKISFIRRIIMLGVIASIGIAVFYSPQFQAKTFESGSGSIFDATLDNPDFKTTGRKYMWDEMAEEIKYSPSATYLFGRQTGAGETFSWQLSGLSYPHNDWLLTEYDFGLVGKIIYLCSNLLMMVYCFLASKKTQNLTTKIFFLASSYSFLPFMIVMNTDNIMVYASFFGNLQYLILGLAYGSLRRELDMLKRPL
jgi:hypothetical protein